MNRGIFVHIACKEAQQQTNSSISDIFPQQILRRHRCSTRMSRSKKQFRDYDGKNTGKTGKTHGGDTYSRLAPSTD